MKRKIISLLFGIILILWLSNTYAWDVMKSSGYGTVSICKMAVTKNNKLYPDYSRSKCYNDWWYYYYNICAKGSSCNGWWRSNYNVSNNSVNSSVNNGVNNSNTLLSSCKIDTKLNSKLKDKLDKVLWKISNKIWQRNKIVKWYVYWFYDNFLWKVANNSKYKNNKIIQEVIKYLRDKFRCGAKKWIGGFNKIWVDNFLWNVFWIKQNLESRNIFLKEFIVFMEEKWIKKEILKDYVEWYDIIPSSDKTVLLSYLKTDLIVKDSVKDSIVKNSLKKINIIKYPKYKWLPLWIWADSYAVKYCKKNWYPNTTEVYRIVLATPGNSKWKPFYWYTSNSWYNYSKWTSMTFSTIWAILCWEWYSKDELKKIWIEKKDSWIYSINQWTSKEECKKLWWNYYKKMYVYYKLKYNVCTIWTPNYECWINEAKKNWYTKVKTVVLSYAPSNHRNAGILYTYHTIYSSPKIISKRRIAWWYDDKYYDYTCDSSYSFDKNNIWRPFTTKLKPEAIFKEKYFKWFYRGKNWEIYNSKWVEVDHWTNDWYTYDWKKLSDINWKIFQYTLNDDTLHKGTYFHEKLASKICKEKWFLKLRYYQINRQVMPETLICECEWNTKKAPWNCGACPYWYYKWNQYWYYCKVPSWYIWNFYHPIMKKWMNDWRAKCSQWKTQIPVKFKIEKKAPWNCGACPYWYYKWNQYWYYCMVPSWYVWNFYHPIMKKWMNDWRAKCSQWKTQIPVKFTLKK